MRRSQFRVISLFALGLLGSAPVAAQAEGPELTQIKAELDKALDAAIDAMFQPGERDPNWNRSGVDLEQIIKSKPGHVVVEVDKEGERSISLYSDRPIADFIPPEWELVAEIGTDNSQPDVSAPIEISELEKGYYVASRSPFERVGDAFCSNIPATARLYKMKDAGELQMPPEIAAFVFRGMLERAKPYTVCARHDIIGDGYRARFFLKDGRSLPVFDDMTGKATIVPMRPTLELLKGD